MIKLGTQFAKDVIAHTSYIIQECGPRKAGKDACKKSARMMEEDFGKVADKSWKEEFVFHPDAFISFLKVISVLYFIGTVFLMTKWMNGFAGFLLLLLAILVAFSQFIMYYHWFDPLYKKAKGYNVIGSIEPEGEVKQQIIISGHHDSANEFVIIDKYPSIYAPLSSLLAIFVVLVFFLSGIHLLIPGNEFYFDIVRYIAVAGLLVTIPAFFFVSNKVVPGASDNLISSSLAYKIGELFGKAKKEGNNLLKHTRLLLVSFDAEESGLRGAYAYTRLHKQELHAVKTYNLNMDTLLDPENMQFFQADINGTVKLSKGMVNDCMAIAKDLGYKAKVSSVPLGGGATDAGEFSRIGVEATNAICMNTTGFRKGSVYHTMKDTADKIHPLAVEMTADVVYNYILMKDKQVG